MFSGHHRIGKYKGKKNTSVYMLLNVGYINRDKSPCYILQLYDNSHNEKDRKSKRVYKKLSNSFKLMYGTAHKLNARC